MHQQTALELEILTHYKEFDAASGIWDSVRVRRLCRLLQITESELARLIRVKPCMLIAWANKGKYPSPLKLLLDLVERDAQRRLLGTVHKKSLFPHI